MSKTAFFLLLAGLLLAAQGRAQSRPRQRVTVVDTVFVYDTIFVTDTIRIRKPVKKMALLAPLPTSGDSTFFQKILLFSPSHTATFLNTGIIGSDTVFQFKQSETMKKISFLGVVVLAFQQMVLAQNNLSLNVGTGGIQLHSNTGLNSRPAPQFWVGAGYKGTFAGGRASVLADLNYHFLFRSAFDASNPKADPFNFSLAQSDFNQSFHLFNVPVGVQWNSRLVRPSLGAEAYYKVSPKIPLWLTDANGLGRETSYVLSYWGASAFVGLELLLSERLNARLRYYEGLTTEQGLSSGQGNFQTKMRRLELNVAYRLR